MKNTTCFVAVHRILCVKTSNPAKLVKDFSKNKKAPTYICRKIRNITRKNLIFLFFYFLHKVRGDTDTYCYAK